MVSVLRAYLELLCRFGDEPTLDGESARTIHAAPKSVPATPVVGSDAQYDKEAERLSQGMTLFLAARDRVLTLSEQRVSGSVYFKPRVLTSVVCPDPRPTYTPVDVHASYNLS